MIGTLMNQKMRILTAGLVLTGAAITSGCSATTTPEAITNPVHASYPIYKSVAALSDASDLVVTGTVVKRDKSRKIMPEGIDLATLPKFKADALGVVVTDITVKVDRQHKGGPKERLTVTEVGGQVGDTSWISDDEPASKPGDKVLLFLRSQNDGTFMVVGGPQGRYLIEGGKAKKRNNDTSVPSLMDGKDAINPPLTDATEISVPAIPDEPLGPVSTVAKPTPPTS